MANINQLGHKHVTFSRKSERYQVSFKVYGIKRYDSFPTLEEAIEGRAVMYKKYGYFEGMIAR